MSNKDAIKELRSLRMRLKPILQQIEDLEKELAKEGAVSTAPEPTPGKKINQQGNRITKKQAVNKYLNK